MLVTLEGMASSVISLPLIKRWCAFDNGFESAPANFIWHKLSMFANSALVRPEHPRNASYSMLVTLLGMVTVVMPVQPEQAYFPILVTPLPIVMEVRPVQLEKAYSPMLITLSGIVTEVRPEQP